MKHTAGNRTRVGGLSKINAEYCLASRRLPKRRCARVLVAGSAGSVSAGTFSLSAISL